MHLKGEICLSGCFFAHNDCGENDNIWLNNGNCCETVYFFVINQYNVKCMLNVKLKGEIIMKKIISVFAAVLVCGTLLTGCGGPKIVGEYDSLTALAESDVFELAEETVAAEKSNTYAFVKTLDGAEELYMDVESEDGNMAMTMGMAIDRIAMKMKDTASETNMTIIITDSVMYMLDDATKTGYSMEADESMLEEYDLETILGDMNVDEEIKNAEDVKVCAVKVADEVYTFEVAETGGGFLFDKNDKLSAILSNDDDTILKVNDFSSEVPDDMFEVPSDYEIVDMASMLG